MKILKKLRIELELCYLVSKHILKIKTFRGWAVEHPAECTCYHAQEPGVQGPVSINRGKLHNDW